MAGGPENVLRRTAFFEREAPLGYALVVPAVLYLTLFIAYPFFMSIYMSFTDAQAGNQKWTFVGGQNYSKVENYRFSPTTSSSRRSRRKSRPKHSSPRAERAR